MSLGKERHWLVRWFFNMSLLEEGFRAGRGTPNGPGAPRPPRSCGRRERPRTRHQGNTTTCTPVDPVHLVQAGGFCGCMGVHWVGLGGWRGNPV